VDDGLDVVETVKVEIEQALDLSKGLSNPSALDGAQRREPLFGEELDKVVKAGATGQMCSKIIALEDVLERWQLVLARGSVMGLVKGPSMGALLWLEGPQGWTASRRGRGFRVQRS
jgi:hypothetical protein